MELSSLQLHTLSDLLEVGEGRSFPPGFDGALRLRLEERLGPHLPLAEEPLRLSKGRLSLLDRCEGLFQADLLGERPPFEHHEASAAGTLAHKSIEIDVAAHQDVPAGALVEFAVARLGRDQRFRSYWEGLDALARDELLMRAVRSVEHFRASFPPIRDLRRTFAPVTEQWLDVRLAGGSIWLRGKVDLLLNNSRRGRSTRVLIDLKDGRPSQEHAEDMRLYALLFTLRYGIPPYRVATFFLGSGQWQPEDVTEEMLDRAVERVVTAVRVAASLGTGRTAALSPGGHCLHCPRGQTCPAVLRKSRQS